MSGITISHTIPSIQSIAPIQPQGAVIHSASLKRDYRVTYGVQSASFVRTVFPGSASGTYTRKTPIPGSVAPKPGNAVDPRISSPPVPYPPSNASAYYANPQHRIVGNGSKAYYYCPTCR